MDDIKSVAKKKKDDTKEYMAAQEATIFKLQKENEFLKEKLVQLEGMLMNKHTSVTPEELICVEQIDIIKQKSAGRELSLDEVKRLDILIKNLRLIKDQSTQAIDHKDYRNVKEAELVAIATTTPTEEDDQ